ncbi:mechanosensitive ion channel family protein [Micromonospora sediminimaris]
MRDDFGDAVGDTLRSILLFLPKALAFVAILVVGWLLAKAALKLVNRLLERVGFDRAVERGGIRRALARSRYDASDIVARLAYYGILLLTLYLAFGVWGPNPISDLIGGVIAWLPRAFVAIVIVVVAAAIASAVKDIISGALGGLSYGRLLATAASAFILGLGIIAALNQIGVATTVTTPVLIAVLATIGGILVVGVGGGLVRPMQSRWESWLARAEQESRTIAEHARAYSASRREADERPADPVASASTHASDVATPSTSHPVNAEPTSAGDDPEATQVVTGPAIDPDATTPLPRQDPAPTQPSASPENDPDTTQVVTPNPPQVPAPRDSADSDSTIVLPKTGEQR